MVLDTAIDMSSACPAGYSATATGTYRHVTTVSTWDAARADCADDGSSTHLVVFANLAENEAVSLLFGVKLWIGLSDRVSTGVYRWVTLEDTLAFPPASGPPWKGGQPNDGGGDIEDCALMETSGLWDDRPCNNDTNEYVCECDAFSESAAQSDPQEPPTS